MDSMMVVVVVAAILMLGAIVWVVLERRRTRALRDRFGPEYERELIERGSQRRVEAELALRTKRVEQLSIRPLPVTERSRYVVLWNAQQAHFVDDPPAAVEEADHLVEEVMARRGYPITDIDQQAADLSVDHPKVVANYRSAHEIAVRQKRGEAGTEDLRKAMVFYRTLFDELLGDRPTEVSAR